MPLALFSGAPIQGNLQRAVARSAACAGSWRKWLVADSNHQCIDDTAVAPAGLTGRIGYWEFDAHSGEMRLPDPSLELLRRLAAKSPARVHSLVDALPDTERLRLRAALDQACALGQPLTVEVALDVANAVPVHLLVHGNPVTNTPGCNRFIGSFHDIGEHQRAEVDRERKVTQFQALLDALPQGVSVVDDQLRLILWNRQVLEVLRFPQHLVYRNARFEDLIRYNAQRGDYGPGDPEQQVAHIVARAREFKPHRFERTMPDGRVLLIEGLPFRFAGEVSGFVTTYTDITEGKRAEELIARQRDVMKVIIDNFPGAVTFCDTDLRFTAYNDEFLRLLEFPPQLFERGWADFEDLARYNARRGEYGPGNEDELVSAMVARARNFQAHRIERQRPNGTWLEIRGAPVPSGGFVTGYIDITERKQAEEALRRNEERWKFALEGARDGVWDWNVVTGEFSYSKRWKEIFGFGGDEAETEKVDWAQRVHPDDRAELHSVLRAHLSGEVQGISVEYRVLCRDGSWRWTQARGMVVSRDADGNPTRVVGTNTDISERKQIERELREAHHTAQARRAQVASLLDNADQGFLSFDRDFIVEPDCSRSCAAMLGRWPAGQPAAQVLFPGEQASRELFCASIIAALDETDDGVREAMLSLLPSELALGQRLLHAQYKLLDRQRVMVVLTDVTEERKMAVMLDRERKRLELIAAAVTDGRSFFEAIDSYRELLDSGLPELRRRGGDPRALAQEAYRAIHTYKGLLNQFGLQESPNALHRIESALADTLAHQIDADRLGQVLALDTLQSCLREDMAILASALGDEFVGRGAAIEVSRDSAHALARLAERLLRGHPVDATEPCLRRALGEASRLGSVSLRAALLDHQALLDQAARRTGKRVDTMQVHGGDDIWLDPQRYGPFLRTLGHILRNAVVHGLEAPLERTRAGKAEAGAIRCEVVRESSNFRLTIADDGRGLDIRALRLKAVQQGLYGDDQVHAVPDDEICSLIFRDNFSTQEDVGELAGRGVGLAAVRDEIRAIAGQVVVRSVPGRGATFVFTLPLASQVDGGSQA